MTKTFWVGSITAFFLPGMLIMGVWHNPSVWAFTFVPQLSGMLVFVFWILAWGSLS